MTTRPQLDARSHAAAAFYPDDKEFLEALKARSPRALSTFFDRFGPHVRRVQLRIIGADRELEDLTHDAFVAAMEGLDRFQGDAGALRSWVTAIAVNVARGYLRRRRRRPWGWFSSATHVADLASADGDPVAHDALQRAYRILDTLPLQERVALPLRYFEGLELTEVATACGISVATAKRRLAKGRARFLSLAAGDRVLSSMMEGSR